MVNPMRIIRNLIGTEKGSQSKERAKDELIRRTDVGFLSEDDIRLWMWKSDNQPVQFKDDNFKAAYKRFREVEIARSKLPGNHMTNPYNDH